MSRAGVEPAYPDRKSGVLTSRRTRPGLFHFGCAPARALPSEAVSRCTRSGFLPRTSRAAYTVRLCDDGVRGHTRSGRTNKKARILCGIRASGIQSAAARLVRRDFLPDRGDPRNRRARTSTPSTGRARTHRSRRGLGRCEGRCGCSRWVSWLAVPIRSAAYRASCKCQSPFQATGRSVNSLYCFRKYRRRGCCAPSTSQSVHASP